MTQMPDLATLHRTLGDLCAKMDRVLAAIEVNSRQDFYTTSEFAERVGRARFTVMEWCRRGRIHAVKVDGRSDYGEWQISHAELERYKAEGLLEPLKTRNA